MEADVHRNCIRYKDVWAAPGSTLHKALTDKDMDLAERTYQQCQKEANALEEKALVTREERAAKIQQECERDFLNLIEQESRGLDKPKGETG
jgi:hypothetical protein